MIINSGNLADLFTSYSAVFNKALSGTASDYAKIAMIVPSSTRDNHYAWLGAMPQMREWLGERVVKNLTTHDYRIKNRAFEATVSVPGDDIEDDQYGVYKPMFQKMGEDAAKHPDTLVFDLLKAGFTTPCYDGQFFFDADHPVGTNGGDTGIVSVSNVQAGSGPAWFLLDCRQAIKPMIFQERRPYEMVAKDRPEDDNVFSYREYIYGVWARCNVGYGLWQLAFASKAPLTAANYQAARVALAARKGDTGLPLGIKASHLVVPNALEADALTILNTEYGAGGASNIWKNTAELIVTPYLD